MTLSTRIARLEACSHPAPYAGLTEEQVTRRLLQLGDKAHAPPDGSVVIHSRDPEPSDFDVKLAAVYGRMVRQLGADPEGLSLDDMYWQHVRPALIVVLPQ